MVNAADHVDVGALAGLKEIMEDDFGLLIDTFVSDCESKFGEIEALLAANDADALSKVSHSLKGSSSNVSAAPFAELARELEDQCKTGDLSAVPDLFARLKAEFSAVVNVLRNEI